MRPVENLNEYAWNQHNSDGHSHPVGLKKPNPFGLYDMYGNVCERVNDTYSRTYYEECASLRSDGICEDPTGPSQGIHSKFRYEHITIPHDGQYALVAKVCTVTNNQRLTVSYVKDADTNDDASKLVMELPYTVGAWQHSDPVLLPLKQGTTTTLYFWRDHPPQYGVSIKEFTLTKID